MKKECLFLKSHRKCCFALMQLINISLCARRVLGLVSDNSCHDDKQVGDYNG